MICDSLPETNNIYFSIEIPYTQTQRSGQGGREEGLQLGERGGANGCPILFVPKSSNIFGYCVEDGQINKIYLYIYIYMYVLNYYLGDRERKNERFAERGREAS